MLPANILDPEVVDDKGKLDWPRDVSPQSRSVGDFIVSMRFEPRLEELVCQYSSLW